MKIEVDYDDLVHVLRFAEKKQCTSNPFVRLVNKCAVVRMKEYNKRPIDKSTLNEKLNDLVSDAVLLSADHESPTYHIVRSGVDLWQRLNLIKGSCTTPTERRKFVVAATLIQKRCFE